MEIKALNCPYCGASVAPRQYKRVTNKMVRCCNNSKPTLQKLNLVEVKWNCQRCKKVFKREAYHGI